MMMRRSKRSKDRLSELPDPILHYIFSFLPTKQAVRASVLSKRWTEFWVSVPHLSFHLNETRAYECSFGRVIHRRRNCSYSIERLHIHLWNFGPVRLDCCISNAIQFNKIRELDITLDAYGPRLRIPEEVFTSSSISVFKLKSLKSYEDLEVELPRSFLSAAHLKTLELENIELTDWVHWEEQELVLSCPVLENLVLVSCFIHFPPFLCISTPQLKKLVIDNSEYEHVDIDGHMDDVTVELHVPNLLSFVYSGEVSAYNILLENLSQLVSAEICASKIYTEGKKEGRATIKVLKRLRNATTLALEGFEIFPPQLTNLLGKALTSFTNLKTLELRTKIQEVGFLLTKCSSIETLVLLLTNQCISDEEKKEKLVLPKQCPLNNLKYVAVRRVRGLSSELGFFRFLLANALALERMTITGYELKNDDLQDQILKYINYHKVPKKALMKFGDRLLKLSQKSPTVDLSFQIL